jgi:hypothetical protein
VKPFDSAQSDWTQLIAPEMTDRLRIPVSGAINIYVETGSYRLFLLYKWGQAI